jgi:hypothetical protein
MNVINELPTFFVLSAERDNLSSRDNLYRTHELEGILNELEIPYKIVEGHYNGLREDAFVVVGHGYEAIVSKLARDFDQECYLRVDENRQARLVFPQGSESIGKWQEHVGATNGLSNYTKDYLTGRIYVCK